MKTTTVTLNQVVEIVQIVRDHLLTGEPYRPHNPAICSDGAGVEIASDLLDWEVCADIRHLEAWLESGDLDNLDAEELVGSMTPDEIGKMLGLSVSLDESNGDLMDYRTGEYIRPATPAEQIESMEAAKFDGGPGAFLVDDATCYVVD